jgi:hypothetical protein
VEAPPAPAAPPRPDADAPPGRGAWALAFLVAFVLLAAFAGVRDLWDADEGRYASVALDMLRAGDVVTPREHGLRFMDKPPLVYWMGAAAFAVLGPTPFAARLPCIVAGAALAALAFLFAAAWTGSRRAAWCAALVLASSLGGMGFSRTVTMDMALSASIAGALYAGWRALAADGGRWARAGLGLAVGLGLLAKGPLAVAATAAVAIAWGLVGVSWRRLLALAFSPLAWLVALAVAAPWYALCERANPGYLEHFVLYEHLRRFREAGHRDFAPVWLYAVTLPALLLPWTLLPIGARLGRPVDAGRGRAIPSTRFAWAWTLALLVFYSAGRNRLFTYILPAFLPLAVLAGAGLADRLWGEPHRTRRLAWTLALFALPLALLAAAFLVLPDLEATVAGLVGARHAAEFVRLAPAALPVLLGTVPLLLAPALVRLLRTPPARLAALALASSCVAWGVDLGAARLDDLRSPRALAAALVRERGPGDAIVCLDLLPQGLRFYEGSLWVEVAGKQPEIVEPWATKDGAGRLHTLDDLERLWASPRRVLLVAREKKALPWLDRGGRLLARSLSGAQRSDLMLLESRPR